MNELSSGAVQCSAVQCTALVTRKPELQQEQIIRNEMNSKPHRAPRHRRSIVVSAAYYTKSVLSDASDKRDVASMINPKPAPFSPWSSVEEAVAEEAGNMNGLGFFLLLSPMKKTLTNVLTNVFNHTYATVIV